ncbi:hypothetical protein Tco_0347682 [Tanacetum coccineum]
MTREEILASNKTRDGKWLEHILLDQVTREYTLELYHSAMSVNFIITMVPVPLNVVAALRQDKETPWRHFFCHHVTFAITCNDRAYNVFRHTIAVHITYAWKSTGNICKINALEKREKWGMRRKRNPKQKAKLGKPPASDVMAAPTIPVSFEENLGDPIDIRVDIIHPDPVAAVDFPAATVVRTLAQHGEAIRGMQGHLLGVPIQEDLTALRFRVEIAEADNASLRARIKTNEAVEKITRNYERLARIKIEQ